MCVALSALFVLNSYGAGIADWSDSAKHCLEKYATAGVTASDKDVEDTRDRWNGSEARNANIVLSGIGAVINNASDLQRQSKQQGNWLHTIWGDVNNPLLEYDTYEDTIVITKMRLADLSIAVNYKNIVFLDNDATCKSAILAAENSAVCVSNNIGEIGHFQLFTYRGMVYDKVQGVDNLVNKFGKFIAKNSDWLNNLQQNREMLVSVNAKQVKVEDVDVRFMDNSNIESLNADNKRVFFNDPTDNEDKEKQITILENIRRYFNPTDQRSVIIQNGTQQGTYVLDNESPNLLVLHNILKPYAKDSDEASKAPNLLSVVKKENGDYAFASYNLNVAVEIRKDGQYLVVDSSIENRKTKVLREKNSFDARTPLKTILKAKDPSIVFFGDSKRDLVVAYRKVDNDYVFFLKDDRDAKNYTFSWAVDDVLSHQLKQLQDKQAPFSFADYARADEWDGDENDKKGTVPTQPVAKVTGQGDDKSDLSYEEKQKLYGGTKQQNKS